MKNQVLQDFVLSKYQIGEGPFKLFHDLNGSVSLKTVERWCKMINETGSIKLSFSPGRPRTVRTKINIQKVKTILKRKKKLPTRKLAKELDISRSIFSKNAYKGYEMSIIQKNHPNIIQK